MNDDKTRERAAFIAGFEAAARYYKDAEPVDGIWDMHDDGDVDAAWEASE